MDADMKNKLQEILARLYQNAGYSADPAKEAVSCIGQDAPQLRQDLNVRILKGGTYKIKGYYLEDNDLTDIRGASTIITQVQEKIIPDLLKKNVEFDCILYHGGGNLLALLPENCADDLGEQLEKCANRYLCTAQSAYFVSKPIALSDLLSKNYRTIMADNEATLEQRKKCKLIFEQAPKSNFLDQELFDGIKVRAAEVNSADLCDCCKKRTASYRIEGKTVCGGCLHKIAVGKQQKNRYLDEYEKHTGCHPKEVHSISEISDRNGDIALFYADGNNMGGIVANCKNLPDMMDFSAFVKSAMPTIVYDAIKANAIDRFEIVALGGDDVFLLVPADKAIRLAAKMIRLYQKKFQQKFPETNSTLSVGICIAKDSTPVQVMLETAEEELDSAKALVRQSETEIGGSLSFRILNTYEGSSADRGNTTLLPYSIENAEKILDFSNQLQNQLHGDTMKTRLRNLSAAFHMADSTEEASLFFQYTNAKESDEKKKIQNLPSLDGYQSKNDGFYTKGSDKQSYYIWEDLIDLVKYGK